MNEQMLQHFATLYASQSKEALIHLAVTMDLAPEAKVAMDAELMKRGVAEGDLAAYRQLLKQDERAASSVRDEKIFRSKKLTNYRTRFLYVAFALVCLWGTLLVLFPQLNGERDDGGVLIAMGIFGVICAWLSSKISMWWAKILHR